MSKTELKKHLKTLDRPSIEQLILNLYSSRKDAKEYLDFMMNPDYDGALEKYRAIIKNEFFPQRGDPKLRFSVCKDAVSDFRSLGAEPRAVADLMLDVAHNAAEFGNDVHMHDCFYSSAANAIESALKYITANGLREDFRGRVHTMWEKFKLFDDGFLDVIEEAYPDFDKPMTKKGSS